MSPSLLLRSPWVLVLESLVYFPVFSVCSWQWSCIDFFPPLNQDSVLILYAISVSVFVHVTNDLLWSLGLVLIRPFVRRGGRGWILLVRGRLNPQLLRALRVSVALENVLPQTVGRGPCVNCCLYVLRAANCRGHGCGGWPVYSSSAVLWTAAFGDCSRSF